MFEFDAPTENQAETPKFFGTMAYPYMNGTLHAGHAFTTSKIGEHPWRLDKWHLTGMV